MPLSWRRLFLLTILQLLCLLEPNPDRACQVYRPWEQFVQDCRHIVETDSDKTSSIIRTLNLMSKPPRPHPSAGERLSPPHGGDYEYNNTGGSIANYVLGGIGLISQTRGSTTNYFLQDVRGSTAVELRRYGIFAKVTIPRQHVTITNLLLGDIRQN